MIELQPYLECPHCRSKAGYYPSENRIAQCMSCAIISDSEEWVQYADVDTRNYLPNGELSDHEEIQQ